MKYLKTLGLAVMAAMAVMALAGTGSASATVLCRTTPVSNDCPKEWDYGFNTSIHASQFAGTSALIEDTSGNGITTCPDGTFSGKTENTGSGTETVRGLNETFKFSNCKVSVITQRLGSFEFHANDEHKGVITSKLLEITVVTPLSVSCVYGPGSGASLGNIEPGAEATININAALGLISGGLTCPSSVRWTASYVMTSPHPLYFATTSA